MGNRPDRLSHVEVQLIELSLTQLDAARGGTSEFLFDLSFNGADRETALSAALVEAKAKLQRCKEDALKKKARPRSTTLN